MENAIMLIDYENLFCSCANQYHLTLTEKGFRHLVATYQGKYNLPNEMVNVVCHYNDYKDLENTVEGSSYVPIKSLEKGENLSDGYLIAYGMHAAIHADFRNIKEKDKRSEAPLETVLLIAGDGIYTGLIRALVKKLEVKVVVVAWSKSLSGLLGKVHTTDVIVEHLEDIFVLSDTPKAISNGLFTGYAITPLEEEVIRFLLTSPRGESAMRNALANIMTKWTRTGIANEIKGDFHIALGFLEAFSTNNGILIAKRLPGREGTSDVPWVQLNHDNVKVQAIKAKIKK